jgi:hypothetical protein
MRRVFFAHGARITRGGAPGASLVLRAAEQGATIGAPTSGRAEKPLPGSRRRSDGY